MSFYWLRRWVSANGRNGLSRLRRGLAASARPDSQLLHRLLSPLPVAYRPVLKMLELRRQQIAQGLANAEQIKAEVARTEASAGGDVAGRGRGDQDHRGSRAAASRLREQEAQKAIARRKQIMLKAREPPLLTTPACSRD